EKLILIFYSHCGKSSILHMQICRNPYKGQLSSSWRITCVLQPDDIALLYIQTRHLMSVGVMLVLNFNNFPNFIKLAVAKSFSSYALMVFLSGPFPPYSLRKQFVLFAEVSPFCFVII
ncbi:hypothetical protein L9F63_007259, partial [Diploptera punctata]